jgi:hypothetical protein
VTERYPFSDLELARRLERAEGVAGARFVEARAKVFPESGATWIELAGAYAMYDGAESPVTQTFGLGIFQAITAKELEQVEAFFHDHAAPASHDVSPLAGLSLFALLHQRGYEPVELSTVMYRPVRLPEDSSALRAERVRARPVSADEHDVWAETTARGWSEFPEYTPFMPELARINRHRKDAVSFLAEMDGRPIAAGALCLHAGVALLAGACTIPEGRRQGAQLALLDSRLRYADEQGCDLAMMVAAPGSASQRNAERHGFRIAYTRTKWQLRPPSGPPSPESRP